MDKIKIESFKTRNLGPIGKNIDQKLGAVNLVYGKNEQGKTFLVEALLSSLYKNHATTRDLDGSFSVDVSGISTKVEKMDTKRGQKMEDHLYSNDQKPVDLSRLSVVKGGELSFEPGGHNKITIDTLKTYLSDPNKFLKIEKKKKSMESVFRSQIENGILKVGSHQGKGKEQNENEAELKEVTRLIEEINLDESTFQIRELADEIQNLEKQIEIQEQAKFYKAYLLDARVNDLKNQANKIDMEAITRIEEKIGQIANAQKQAEASRQKAAEAEDNSRRLEWVDLSIQELQKLTTTQSKEGFFIPWVLTMFLTGLSLISLALLPQWVTMVSIAITLVALIWSWLSHKSDLQNHFAIIEADRIYRDASSRFGKKISSITSLQDLLKDKRDYENVRTNAVQQYQEKILEIREYEKNRDDLVRTVFPGVSIPETQLKEQLRLLRSKKSELDAMVIQPYTDLQNMGVTPNLYSAENPGVEYDSTILNRLITEKNSKDETIQKLETRTRDFKVSLSRKYKVSPDATIEDILTVLEARKEALEKAILEFRTMTLAWLAVNEVLQEHQNNELQTIQDTLNNTTCGEILFKITKIYKRISIEDNQILVHSDTDSYQLGMLSTGTQEQVLLAIRLGLLTHLLGERKGFIVLDDAFQHSDWDRRENMMEMLTELIQDGWQILYFTMDDHVRSLFETKLKPAFPTDFTLIDLNEHQAIA